ncbi:MAG: hypothetical protein LBI28_08685 [Treponema sp.]|jgi:hypothetical protein|nr:hypothetical protein [Treponema sp.]
MRNTFKFRFAGIGIMLAMYAVFGAAVMLLWNALMTQIFGLMELNYLQSVGLLILGRLLFGGLGGGLHNRHRGMGGHLFHHDNKLREKWMTMSEDERKEFMENEMHRRFSPLHGFGERTEQNRGNRNE